MTDWAFLESSNKLFRLLFFSPEASNLRYLGIQDVNFRWSDPRQVKMVWIANRGNPLTDTSGTLNITADGNLVLNNHNGTFLTINGEQPAMSSNTSATLLDTGNLVLTAGERIVWQSFDYPSDTWLPGMKLGLFNLNRGQPQQRFLTSFLSPQLPSLGPFTLGVDPNNPKELVIWRRGVLYWRSGMWNGYNFSYFPFTTAYDLFTEFNFSFSYCSDESQSYFTYTKNDNYSWIEMSSLGSIRFNGGIQVVSCLDEVFPCPTDQLEYRSTGCASTPEPSNCKGGNLFKMASASISWHLLNNYSLGISDCEDMCTRDCSCTAYASGLPDGSGCKFSHEKQYFDDPGNSFYIRYDIMIEQDRRRKRRLGLAIGGPIASLFILLFYLLWKNRNFAGNNRRSQDGMSHETQSLMYELKSEALTIDNNELPLFNLPCIQMATDDFSDANKIGEGGFGSVYKGKFLNGQEIAVKRLSESSRQGLEEFKNEVILISRLQHCNLVRLLGFCIQGDERILVYEYLPNKSLDSFIFDVTRRSLLDWKMRVNIIERIAQGLQYLHKYSRLKIIHRDLKASNILLDNNMNPKISDFGTARIFGDNESQANTKRIVGTYGYMSPEYAMKGIFSVKSDVFSFGVMILEIISGKKNTDFYQPDCALNLLGYAWDLWKEGKGMEIIDNVLVDTCSTTEVMRYIQVGFLCVQESAADRPTISEVVFMLNNEMLTIPVPKQPAFSAIVSVNHANTPEIPKPCSVNDVTISEVEGR